MALYTNVSANLEVIGLLRFHPGVPVEVKDEVTINQIKHIPTIQLSDGKPVTIEKAPEPKVVLTTENRKEENPELIAVNPEAPTEPEKPVEGEAFTFESLDKWHFQTCIKHIKEVTDKELLQKIVDEAKPVFVKAAKDRLAQLHATDN